MECLLQSWQKIAKSILRKNYEMNTTKNWTHVDFKSLNRAKKKAAWTYSVLLHHWNKTWGAVTSNLLHYSILHTWLQQAMMLLNMSPPLQGTQPMPLWSVAQDGWWPRWLKNNNNPYTNRRPLKCLFLFYHFSFLALYHQIIKSL